MIEPKMAQAYYEDITPEIDSTLAETEGSKEKTA